MEIGHREVNSVDVSNSQSQANHRQQHTLFYFLFNTKGDHNLP